jgi:hypothetical protein
MVLRWYGRRVSVKQSIVEGIKGKSGELLLLI